MRRHWVILAGAISISSALSARADIFVLANAGQVRGELVNKDESPRKTYVIRVSNGVEVSLDKAQVKQVVPQTQAQLEYEELAPKAADTVDGQWQMSEWCREHNLKAERTAHLERIIELDPNHAKARGLLGYSFADGQWKRPEQRMEEKGYVRYQNRWVLPQEVAMLEQKRQDELAQKSWIQKVKRLREQLSSRDSAKVDQARKALAEIRDPQAVPALKEQLLAETDQKAKLGYIEVLAAIGSDEALGVLAVRTIEDPDIEIRLACMEKLQGKYLPRVIAYYLSDNGLKSKDNGRVNRAGYALGKMADKTTIPALITALVTTHKFKVQTGPPPGQTSSTFSRDGSGGGGGGIAVGGSPPKIIHQPLQNREVLDTLIALTGQDFGFDVPQWNKWWATQKRPEPAAGRRDDK